MHIKFVEIQNFRKLKSCRVELTEETTLFVGANNSGKTSAMEALRSFLIDKNDLNTMDFTLSNWIEINKIGKMWETTEARTNIPLSINDWSPYLPSLDVWIHVENKEVHYVTHLIPTLDWQGGLIGVRLRFEPKNIEDLYNDYYILRKSAKETIKAAESAQGNESISLELWPRDMRDFLSKKIGTQFTVRSYILDPSKLQLNGSAKPQDMPLASEFIDRDPFKGLILIHSINAQRGFSDPNKKDSTEGSDLNNRASGMLSSQLRAYYNKHLNPADLPDSTDIGALHAIEIAQKSFDQKLRNGFSNAISELESLGYPGFSDPKITISTKIKPMDSLDHSSAVQFELMNERSAKDSLSMRLPEQYNGLGYQNLISMVFKLMRFRDEWMQVGKVAKKVLNENNDFFHPLHLVLVEEPEAHLHVRRLKRGLSNVNKK